MLDFQNWLVEQNMPDTKNWSEEEHKEFNDLRLKNLVDACAICDKYKVRYALDAGTLLGLYRDKKMIDGDSDNDISIMAEDITPEFLEAIKDYCISPEAKRNFMQPNTFPDFEDKETFEKPVSLKYHTIGSDKKRTKFKSKMIWTDLFILYPHEDYHLFMLGMKYFRIPNKFLGKAGSLTHEGTKFKIPTSVEGYLEHVFGKGWSEPDPNYVSSKDNKSFYVTTSAEHGPYTYNWATKKGNVEK
jgi:hypothetical protein